MKKSFLLLIPVVFVLSACKEVGIGFTNESHDKGWDYTTMSTAKPGSVDSYSYRNPDTLDNNGLTQAIMTFGNITKSETNVQDVEKIRSYININSDILESIVNPLYFSTKETGDVFLGVESTYVNGEITFHFNKEIKNIEIIAKQYNYTKVSFEETFVVDENVAISVNDSGYIKVNGEVNQENQTVASTTCSFHLATPSNDITIKAGPYRAILEKITLYY